MHLGVIKLRIATTEDGEEVDRTPLLVAFQGIKLSAMHSREHDHPGSGFRGISKDTVGGIKMGMQIAVKHAYGKAVGKAFERRLNPDLPESISGDDQGK